MSESPSNILVASHRRSGTHLLIDTILNNFPDYDPSRYRPRFPKLLTLERFLPGHPEMLGVSKAEGLLASRPWVMKSHCHAQIDRFFAPAGQAAEIVRKAIKEARVIYVCRDVRDVLVSLYYYMQSFDPRLENIPFGRFLRTVNDFDDASYSGVLDRPSYWAFHVDSWLGQKDVLIVRFCDLLTSPGQTVARIARFVGRAPYPELRNARVEREPRQSASLRVRRFLAEKARSLMAISRRKRPSGELGGLHRTSVEFRKGTVGDWREHFSAEDVTFVETRAGSVNRRLGFE